MDNDERKEMIRRLAEQLSGNSAKDFALEAVINAMLNKDEYVEVHTIHPDHKFILPINKYENRHQVCLYRKVLYSAEQIDAGRYEY